MTDIAVSLLGFPFNNQQQRSLIPNNVERGTEDRILVDWYMYIHVLANISALLMMPRDSSE